MTVGWIDSLGVFTPQSSQGQASTAGIYLKINFPEWEIHVYPRQPTCHNCNRPAVRMSTSSDNQNGNAGRPYFICPACQWEKRWVCWADTRGIEESNPRCGCGQPSRQDRIGSGKGRKSGKGFWTCVTGSCEYYSENVDGTPGISVEGFYPWLCLVV